MAKFQKTKSYKASTLNGSIVATQIAGMKAIFPSFKARKLNGGRIEFIGEIIARPELPTYTVSIIYKGYLRPDVTILTPKLVEHPPHVYPGKVLCLFHPDNYNWKKENSIANDIVPLIASWIYFYEAWLEHDEWFGPEAHHVADTVKKDKIDNTEEHG